MSRTVKRPDASRKTPSAIHRKGNKDVPGKLVNLLLSIFMGYMTVSVSIVDYPERSLFVMVIFSILYYVLVTPRILRWHIYIVRYMMQKWFKLRVKHLERIYEYYWFLPAFLTGIGSVILAILTVFYLTLRHKYTLTPQYWVYSDLGKNIPSKIWIFYSISLILLFIAQLIVLQKYEKTKPLQSMATSLVSTITTAIMINASIALGIVVYFLAGTVLFG